MVYIKVLYESLTVYMVRGVIESSTRIIADEVNTEAAKKAIEIQMQANKFGKYNQMKLDFEYFGSSQ